MKKLKCIVMVVLVLIVLGLIVTKVQAVNYENLKTLKTLTISTPAGNYKTGDVITFVATFESEVGDIINTTEKLDISFSESKIERSIFTGTAVNNTITYQYTIQEKDKGTLIFKNYSIKALTGSEGSIKTTEFDNNVKITANKNQGGDTGAGDQEQLTWTDFSKATYEWTGATSTDHRSLELNIKNVNLTKEGHSYWVHISHNKNDTPDITKIGDTGANAEWKLLSSSGKIGSSSINSYLETNGDIYIWVAENQARETKIVLTAKKVERLLQLPLTKRIVGYFNNGNTGGATNIFLYEPTDTTNRKVKCKIGKVTDNTILKNIKNNNSNAMNELLKYAKATTPIAEKTLNIGTNSDIVSNLNLVNGAYYYVYFELENNDGKYYPVEDVELYQASIIGKSINLLNHTDRNFIYNITDDEESKTDVKQPEDNTTATGKLPQTGINTTLIVLAMGIVIVAALVGAKQYKKYNIKY